jgi:hypothetical protein
LPVPLSPLISTVESVRCYTSDNAIDSYHDRAPADDRCSDLGSRASGTGRSPLCRHRVPD